MKIGRRCAVIVSLGVEAAVAAATATTTTHPSSLGAGRVRKGICFYATAFGSWGGSMVAFFCDHAIGRGVRVSLGRPFRTLPRPKVSLNSTRPLA